MPDMDYENLINELKPIERKSLTLSTTDFDLETSRETEIFGSPATIRNLVKLGLVEKVKSQIGLIIRMTDAGFEVAKILTSQHTTQAQKQSTKFSDMSFDSLINELKPREQKSLTLSTMDLDFEPLRDAEIFGSYATIKRLDELGLIVMVEGPMGNEIRMSDRGFEVAKILTSQHIEHSLKVQALKAEIIDLTGQMTSAGLKQTYASFLPKRWSQVTVVEELQGWRDRLAATFRGIAEEMKNPRQEAG